ncbi:hypothetical protein DER44DRAFT_440970 [Fusarium oxysporum]|nr:hypothetical protein DER44DRAFT_440970 [Fusarium oxysporum]
MASKPKTIVTKRDRTKENFSRAVWRLMKRCNQMHTRYGTDVYVLFKRKYQHYEYNSSQSTSFPTPLAELVRSNLSRRFQILTIVNRRLPIQCLREELQHILIIPGRQKAVNKSSLRV